jgi:hypothetical protein
VQPAHCWALQARLLPLQQLLQALHQPLLRWRRQQPPVAGCLRLAH